MINLYHLKYFIDAVSGGSLAASSEKNKVGRSAVSQAVKSLETSLGVDLLIHRKNSFELTPQGKILAERSETLFSSLERLGDELRKAKHEIEGPLRIGASHSISLTLLPDFLSRFTKKNPRVEIELHVGNAIRIRELFDSRSIDIGIAVADPNLDDLDWKTLKTGKFALVGKPTERGGQPRYLVGDRGAEVSHFKKILKKTESSVEHRFIAIQSWEVIAEMAAQGLGYGLVPDFILNGRGTERKSPKVMKTNFALSSYELRAYFGSRQNLSRGMFAFIDLLKKS